MSQMFIDGTKINYHPQRLGEWLQGIPVIPLHVEVSPTSGCNHRCVLCCVDYLGHKAEYLSQDILLNLASSFAECGVKSFLLAGEGEPLLNHHCAEMINLAASKGVSSAINTNGVLFTPELSKDVLAKIDWIRFSIQAADGDLYAKLHGTKAEDLEKVKTNIAAATAFKNKHNLPVRIGIQQILLNENVEQIYPLAKLAKELRVDYYTVKRHSTHPANSYSVPEDIHLQAQDQFSRSRELASPTFLTLIRDNDFSDPCIREYRSCLGLPFITQVLADGGIYTCCQHFRMAEFSYGNLHDHSFAEIMRSERRQQVMLRVEQNIDVDKCMTYCRHHNVNKYLWDLRNPPEHVNFI